MTQWFPMSGPRVYSSCFLNWPKALISCNVAIALQRWVLVYDSDIDSRSFPLRHVFNILRILRLNNLVFGNSAKRKMIVSEARKKRKDWNHCDIHGRHGIRVETKLRLLINFKHNFCDTCLLPLQPGRHRWSAVLLVLWLMLEIRKSRLHHSVV